ncbi:IS5 family transposase [bacterium AH-315-O15]|nr:IS5 family transposase [bacterium AH-315-O15]
MKSRVYPTYKTKYRVENWRAYERALVQRGDVMLWLSAEARNAWRPSPSGQPGGQKRFSDQAINIALTLRLVFRLPLRQAEGFLRSVLSLMDVDLEAPDHTTLSRRSRHLDIELYRIPSKGPIHVVVDSTGLSIVGEGEWAAAKHGGRGQRGWKKLHLGVDGAGVIVAQMLTDATVDDAMTDIGMIDAIDADRARVTADAAYDTLAFYETATARGATIVIPPDKTARVSRRRPRSSARDRTIKKIKTIGRRRWKKEAGYHRQARVENAFFRYKSIIGGGLRARSPGGRVTEAAIACNILNQMTEAGRPTSYSIGR